MLDSFTINFVGVLASVGTLIIAILIYVEAQKIRREEWVLSVENAFNQYDHMLQTEGTAALLHRVLEDYDQLEHVDVRIRYVIANHLNILHILYRAKRYRTLGRHYAAATFQAEVRRYNWARHEFQAFMNWAGYDKQYQDFIVAAKEQTLSEASRGDTG